MEEVEVGERVGIQKTKLQRFRLHSAEVAGLREHPQSTT